MKKIKLPVFCAILSVVSLLGFNIPFLAYAWNNSEGFGAVVGCILLALLILFANFGVCYLLCFLLRRVGRVLIALSHILNTICVYFILGYNTMMVESVVASFFNTRTEEAGPYFSVPLVLTVVVLGILPAVWIVLAKVDYGKWKRAGMMGGGSVAVALLCLLCAGQFQWAQKHSSMLTGLSMPWSYVVNSGVCAKKAFQRLGGQEQLPDAVFTNSEKRAVVLVIGESARRANCSLYGYGRETFPLLSKQDSLHVLMARANDTWTMASMKCILEHNDGEGLYECLPNYVCRTGTMVQWRTTNWGEPEIIGPQYLTREDLASGSDTDKYDEVLLNGLRSAIEESDRDKVFIVLHLGTSHGPAYCERYPERFGVFQPVCDNVEEAQLEPQKLINAYDNTMLYTDYILNSVIDTLKTISDRSCAMFFISDHGESLGEDGLYIHGYPVEIAPREEVEVPCFVWLSSGYRSVRPEYEVRSPLQTVASADQACIDQHWVFHSILDLLDISSPVSNPSRDIFHSVD